MPPRFDLRETGGHRAWPPSNPRRKPCRPYRDSKRTNHAHLSPRTPNPSGRKLTKKSKSLAGPKSSRSAEPKRESSEVFHRSQNALRRSESTKRWPSLTIIQVTFEP